jgi:RNA polymerase sigma-70 factor (ECF subfamily)
VFERLWDSRKRLNPAGSLRGWLFTALKNHVLSVITHQRKALQTDIEYDRQRGIDRKAAAPVTDLSDYRALCQAAAARLPEKRRQIFRLRADEGLTSREVAEHLGISVHTAKSQYQKAVEFIRVYASEHLHQETGS